MNRQDILEEVAYVLFVQNFPSEKDTPGITNWNLLKESSYKMDVLLRRSFIEDAEELLEWLEELGVHVYHSNNSGAI